jgi:hypothetical protein
VTVYEYVRSPEDRIHLARQADIVDETTATRTLCGHVIQPGWKPGDETMTGLAATCVTCRRKVTAMLRREAGP